MEGVNYVYHMKFSNSGSEWDDQVWTELDTLIICHLLKPKNFTHRGDTLITGKIYRDNLPSVGFIIKKIELR